VLDPPIAEPLSTWLVLPPALSEHSLSLVSLQYGKELLNYAWSISVTAFRGIVLNT
jgi:hypothetical protein